MNRLVVFSTILALGMAACSRHDSKNEPDTMTVATYNIRIINKQDSIDGNGWGTRLPRLAEVIRFHEFDIFGTQEGLRPALDDLKSQLPGYEFIGVGCDDGATLGGHNAIFYDTNKFELIDNGTFWLSETPDTISMGWDGAYRRICTWGKFRLKPSDKTFVYFNLHLDHIGKIAQEEGAKLVLDKINELADTLPVMLSGDFNTDQLSTSYRLINSSDRLTDAFETADLRYIETSTFNNYDPTGAFLSENGEYQRIDHIFLSPQFDVKKYGVLTDTYRTRAEDDVIVTRVPSDHYPVKIVVNL